MSKIIAVAVWCVFLLPAGTGAQQFYTTQDIRSESEQPFEPQRIVTPSGAVLQGNDSVAGPGMEIKDVGGARVIVPKGAKVYKEGSRIIFEDIGEYLARRFETLEAEITLLRARLQQNEQQIEGLMEEVRRLTTQRVSEGGEHEEGQ